MISKNLIQRLAVAAVFIPLLIWVFFLGGIPFLIFVEALIVLSIWEFFSLTKIRLYLWQKILMTIPAIHFPYAIHVEHQIPLLEFTLAIMFLAALPQAFRRELGDIGRSIAMSFFAVVYLTIGFSTLLLIRNAQTFLNVSTLPFGQDVIAAGMIVYLFASVWIIDTAAYYVGVNLGKHKLSPAISPNKTVEGFIGGLVGAVIAAGIFHFVFLQDVGFPRLILPGLIIALFGQIGDLVESIFKREMGVKDSSHLIPGHGGILDRFDSLVFAAPALYLYLRYLA